MNVILRETPRLLREDGSRFLSEADATPAPQPRVLREDASAVLRQDGATFTREQ